MAKPKTNAAEALKRTRASARKVSEVTGKKRLKRLLNTAQNDLNKRITQAEGLKGPGKDSFTAAQLRTTLVQVEQVLKDLNGGMKDLVVSQGKAAADAAADGTLDYMARAERKFKGINARLPLAEAVLKDRAVTRTEASILRRLTAAGDPAKQGILQRYGMSTLAKFEEKLQLGIATRKPWSEMRADLIGESTFLQQAPASWAERIVRTECLVGETVVTGAVVRAALRRWYEGDVVQVITEAGRNFTTTPNHPMLTTRVWVAAGKLRQGDNLICYRGKQDAGSAGDKYVAAPPSTIAEIFDSLSTIGIGERRATAQPDFHGDGLDGEVDVLRPNGILMFGNFAAIYEPLAQNILSPPDSARPSFCTSCRRLLSVQEQACFCGRALMLASGGNAPSNSTVRRIVFGSQMLGALAAPVALDDFIRGQIAEARVAERIESVGCGLGTAASEAELSQSPLDRVRSDTDLLGGTLGAQPGDIEFDRIREIRVRPFVGHVYNLSTADGYFAINGAYTGNTMAAYNRAGWETTRDAQNELGDMVKILSATFDDRTGWDSYLVHGQIRRVDEAFEGPFGMYQHPPNRPNDREVVVPHRISWPLPASLAPRSEGEAEEAYTSKVQNPGARGGTPPSFARAWPLSTVPREQFGKS